LRQRETEIESLGLAVVVVTFQAGPLVEAYVRQTGLKWPILIDPTLSLYRACGMERGMWWDIWGPATMWTYFKLMARGRRPHGPAGDINQLGGDLLIDPNGTVRLHHIGKGPADRPSVESLLAAVRAERAKS
jgi:alkyl-hydroperoxide reductase/thiol specific antioxidant family protein